MLKLFVMKKTTFKQAVTELAQFYNLSYLLERRILNSFAKLQKITKKNFIQEIDINDFNTLYKKWQNEGSTGESMGKRFQYIRRVLAYMYAQGEIKKNIGSLWRMPKQNKAAPVILSKTEIKNIENAKLQNIPHLERVRDMFIFQCYTGLSFCDLKHFNKKWIINFCGEKYLNAHRQKTHSEFILPFLPEAKKIAEKYGCKLPAISNAKFNKHLKEIQTFAKCQTWLTSKIARSTFGQIMIDTGFSIEVVAKMLGHKSTIITERYYARSGLKRLILENEKMKKAA